MAIFTRLAAKGVIRPALRDAWAFATLATLGAVGGGSFKAAAVLFVAGVVVE
jgi:hypothetical protein